MLALKEKSIGEVMTKKPQSIEPHQKLELAEDTMRKLRITHLPVLSGGDVVGILSASDVMYLKTFRQDDFRSYEVRDVMLPDPYCVTQESPIREVALKMFNERIGSALVLDIKGDLAGIFTANDALKMLSH